MNPQRWQRIEVLFQAAIERQPQERDDYLKQACGADDATLREEVAALLVAHERAEKFIEKPAFKAKALEAAAGASATGVEAAKGQPDGRRLGAYRLLREIGRGGMGAVFLATRDDDEYRKEVAVKLIKRGMDTDFILRRFKNERQILASLEHPNIARLIDGGTSADSSPYLVMEYVEGTPVGEYCDRQKLSTAERLRLFRQICAAVHYAHQNLVIHRDIKPSNILVMEDGTPKLLDFGIAKLLTPDADQKADETETALRLMTPNYASPEQVRGERVTTASDVYSLGVVLYELLTGHRPYRVRKQTAGELMKAVLEQEPEKPSTAISRVETDEEGAATTVTPESVSATREGEIAKLKRSLSGDIDNIVLMALRKEPERRYASVEQFSEDLRRHLEGLPVLAHKDTFAYRAGKFVRRNKVAVAAAALVLIAITVGIFTTLRQRARAERRFNEVRKLARAFIFDYHDAIADLQGATPVRERLVKDALEYLNSLAGEASDDDSLKLEIAEAYKKVADVQGNSYHSNLGDTDGALASYRKAVGILEPLASSGDAAARVSLAHAHSSMGDVLWDLNRLDETLKSYEIARDFYEPWVAAHASDIEVRRSLARIYEKLADLYSNDGFANLGRTAEAEPYYRKSLALREELAAANPDAGIIRRDLYDSYLHLADYHRITGDGASAEEGYRRCLGIIEELSAAEPDNISRRVEVANCATRLGLILNQTERFAEAITFLERAVKVMEFAAAADPASAYYKRSLGVVYNHAVNSLLKLNRADDALRYGRQSLVLSEALYKSEPQNLEYRNGLAISQRKVGQALALKGDIIGALHHHRQSLTMCRQMAEDANEPLSRDNLALAYNFIGELLARSKDYRGALENHQQAQTIHEALAAADPQNAAGRHKLAETCMKVAEAHKQIAEGAKAAAQQSSHWRAARAAYQRSLEVYEALKAAGLLSQKDAGKPDEVARELARCDAAMAKSR